MRDRIVGRRDSRGQRPGREGPTVWGLEDTEEEAEGEKEEHDLWGMGAEQCPPRGEFVISFEV